MNGTDMNGFAIQTFGITKAFGNNVSVDGLNLSIRKGELFALLGPNGAGKTTTIKMLCCLLSPTGGTASIMGHDIRTDPLSVKKIIDVSPQETAVAEHLDAWGNLSLMGGVHGLSRSQIASRSGELLELMGLTERARDRVSKYSGGMKRRLSIAMALVSDPQVLFLDEPTLGLDPQSRRSIWEYISGLKGKKTIILTTHYLEEADNLADKIAIIDYGKIVASGTAEELKNQFGETKVMIVKCKNAPPEIVLGLKEIYPDVSETAAGIEIRGDDVNFTRVVDYFRSKNVDIESTSVREVSLDDVFLRLTGRGLRE